MKHVLHVDTEKTWRGGELQALHLACGQRKRGWKVTVCGPEESAFIRKAAERGLTTLSAPMHFPGDPQTLFRIMARHNEEPIDIVHSHTSHSILHASFAAAACRIGLHFHTRRVDFRISPISALTKYKYKIAGIIAISEQIRKVLMDCGIHEQRIKRIYSGIDIEELLSRKTEKNVRQEFGINDDELLAGTVGHLADHKDHQNLLKAAKRILNVCPCKIMIVGAGSLMPVLKRTADELGIDAHVIFTGFREDVPDLIAGFDLFVLPSKLEGLCTSLLDAMALRKPVVACKTGGIPEVVADGETGLLVPPEDDAALAEAVTDLFLKPEKMRKYGGAGERRVKKYFTADRMVEGTLDYYKAFLK